MARDGLRLLACAGVALALLTHLSAAPPDDPETKVRTQLAVQAALQQGRDHLQRGNYQAAVYVLEAQVARVDGNREYLNALRDAYRGYVRELREAHRDNEVPTYLGRLLILDPGASLEQNAPAAPKPPPPTLAGLAGASAPPGKLPAGPALALPAAPRPAITARGKEDDDPFADANGRAAQEGRRLVGRADDEFARDHFEAAGRLYEQANRADRSSTAGCMDRWAYCKLYGVVQALNRPGAGAGADLEREVRQALSMAPQLNKFGEGLLRRIEDRRGLAGRPADAPVRADSGARVEVRHGGREGRWNVATTTNFRVDDAQVVRRGGRPVGPALRRLPVRRHPGVHPRHPGAAAVARPLAHAPRGRADRPAGGPPALRRAAHARLGAAARDDARDPGRALRPPRRAALGRRGHGGPE